MISVVASVTLKPGQREKYLDIFTALMPTVHKEDGCIEYYPNVDYKIGWPVQSINENRVVILEKWESPEALNAHNNSSHMVKYREQTADMIEEVDLRVLKEV